MSENTTRNVRVRASELEGRAWLNTGDKNLTLADLRGAHFKKGRGCKVCRHTGYRGRTGVFELLVLDEQVRNAILAQKASFEIRAISINHSGLITLLEDGLVKAMQGDTTIEEVLRVTQES